MPFFLSLYGHCDLILNTFYQQASSLSQVGLCKSPMFFSDEHDSMITRNYVDYMTSNAILIGAEIDKIVSIIVVIEVLAVVITLHSACSIKQFWTVLWRTIFRGLFRMRLQTELLNQTVVFNQAKGKAVLQQLYLQIYKASQRFRKSYRPKT
jgi:hypothetical protein